jgi:integrase
MRVKLTDKGIERLRPPQGPKPLKRWDKQIAGFGVFVSPGGAKTFRLAYRYRGERRNKGLGRWHGDGSLAEARDRARKILQLAQAGIDPEKHAELEARKQAEADANTFAAVRAQFIASYAVGPGGEEKPRLRAWKAVKRYLERDLAAWDAKPIGEITKRDVIAAVEAKVKDGPYAANRLLRHVGKLFNWCVARDLLVFSPAAGVQQPGEEHAGERTLDWSEIKALWQGWEEQGWPWAPIFSLLLITGQRRTEIAGARWEWIRPRAIAAQSTETVTAIDWILALPSSVTKNKRPHDLALPPLATNIIGALPRIVSSPFLFPARGNGRERHANGFDKAKLRSSATTGVNGWKPHDLRRTFTSRARELGIPGSSIAAALNHTPVGVTGKHYDRADLLPEIRNALAVWSNKLATVVATEPPSNITDLAEVRAARS